MLRGLKEEAEAIEGRSVAGCCKVGVGDLVMIVVADVRGGGGTVDWVSRI
jgi:hypothetical protein